MTSALSFCYGNRVIESGKLVLDKTVYVYQTDRQYVYGLDYIDEHVAQYHGHDPGTLHFTLTDANYNVVALTDSTGSVVEQYRHQSYSQVRASENAYNRSLMRQAFSSNPRILVIR